MRTPQLVSFVAAALLGHGVTARELQPNALTAQIYESGSVHEGLMAKKMVRILTL
jgi:hypothetical protein